MYVYQVVEAKNVAKAQIIINDMAKQGWRVISNTYWLNFKAILIITFAREIKDSA